MILWLSHKGTGGNSHEKESLDYYMEERVAEAGGGRRGILRVRGGVMGGKWHFYQAPGQAFLQQYVVPSKSADMPCIALFRLEIFSSAK